MARQTLVLGIESSAHTLGVAVASGAKGGRILSNCSAKYASLKEGYIPRKLADHHAENLQKVLAQALQKAGVKLSDIDFVAYTQGPGMGHCLKVGYDAARSISAFTGAPLVPVNHAIAHAEIVRHFAKAKDPLVVYVSGGNTQILYQEKNRYKVIGETLDIGIGNFLDLLGRSLDLEPPDAVGVLLLAAKPGRKYTELPYIVKGMSVSYSGMLTYCQKVAKEGKASKDDLCYSGQETAFAALCEASERALLHTGKREVLLCGGNGRNKRLAQMMGLMANENGARLCVCADEYLGDNAAMIALTGLLMAKSGSCKKNMNAKPVQDLRIDSSELFWRKATGARKK